MEQTLDDVKSQNLNRDPNVRSFKVGGNRDLDAQDITQVTEIQSWMADAYGFTILDFQSENNDTVFTLRKFPRTHIQP